MKLYISGPMTGYENFNYPAFHEAKKQLEEKGFEVISPADMPIREDWDWIDYILLDIDAVFQVDGVATLLGCGKSQGSRIECAIAKNRGVPVKPLAQWLQYVDCLQAV